MEHKTAWGNKIKNWMNGIRKKNFAITWGIIVGCYQELLQYQQEDASLRSCRGARHCQGRCFVVVAIVIAGEWLMSIDRTQMCLMSTKIVAIDYSAFQYQAAAKNRYQFGVRGLDLSLQVKFEM